MNKSRTKNTIRNSLIGIISQLIIVILSFANRTAFIKILGVEYLGISGLFSNILAMLALSDLGVYTVMVYSLYDPIAKNDTRQINAYVRYFQRIYNVVALAVLVIGLALIPFLPILVNGSVLSNSELVKYYVILLLNSAASYLVTGRSTLLRADQRVYIVKVISTLSTALMYVVQIALLVVFNNYTLYLICQVFFTFISNIAVSFFSLRVYPFLREKSADSLNTDLKGKIVENLKATFLYKIGASVMNSTDNILISVIVGTAMVGYYSNYVTIFTMVNTFIMLVIDGVLASIGNYFVTETKKNQYALFKMLIYVFYNIATFCVACYLSGMNDFISIWIGQEYVIGNSFLVALAANRFVFCLIHPIWITRESSGMFVRTKYVTFFSAAINLLLSVVLGRLGGITGIIAATAISYLSTVYWYEPNRFVEEYFNENVSEYWRYIIRILVPMAFPLVIGWSLMHCNTHSLLLLMLKFIICGVAVVAINFLFYRKLDEYIEVKRRILLFLHRKS